MPQVQVAFRSKMRCLTDRLTARFESGKTRPYPRVDAALSELRWAVQAEMKLMRFRRRKEALLEAARNKRHLPCEANRKWYFKCRRAEKRIQELSRELARHTAVKTEGGRSAISTDCIVKVFLSHPGGSARGMEQSFRDVTAVDAPSVSRPSMDKIRSTWVENYKEKIMHVSQQRVSASRQVAFFKKATFVPVVMLHI